MNRNFGLDIMRAVSIWAVLLKHAGYNLGLPDNVGIGGIGVEVFFVLSGFLIGSILVASLLKENSIASLKKFWIRRWFRILPAYYLVLAFKFIFIDHSVGWHIIYYYLFLQNNFYGIKFYDVSWSLVIEEWFYIAVPVYLFIVIRVSAGKMKIILYYIILFIALENIARFGYLYYSHVTSISGNPVFRLDSLCVGVFFAFIKRIYPVSYGILRNVKAFIFGVILFIGYLIYYGVSNAPNIITETIGLFVFSLSIGILIPYIETINLSDTRFLNKFFLFSITQTSLLTYCIYLIHPFIYDYIISKNIFLLPSIVLQQVMAIVLIYILSFIVYKYYEKPVMNLRERFQ